VAQYRRIAEFPRVLKFYRNTKSPILSFNPNCEVFCFDGNNAKHQEIEKLEARNL
jgi:hypothetical protein